jgi:hypothetical protein
MTPRKAFTSRSRPSTTPTAASPCSPTTNCATASPKRIGTDERTLAATPVLDPARTVQTDFSKVL